MPTEGISISAAPAGRGFRNWKESAIVALLALLLVTTGADLWRVWLGDSSLGHAPLVPAVVLFLLWQRRAELRDWSSASAGGAVILIVSALLYAGAYWADIEFLKPLSAGALGFLLFTIPWPTTIVGRLQLPLQLTSSAYAAIFAGILGIPVHRDGVTLSILPDPARPPTYVILVAQQCSGLTSLIVLLAIGYLVAYFTPAHWSKRALLFFITAPLALLANAARLTFILIAGASHGAEVAQWVHDHEQPVLVFACTMGLMEIRAIILRGERSRKPVAVDEEVDEEVEEEWDTEEAPKPRFPRAKAFLGRIRLTVAIAALLFALAGSAYARRPDPGEGAYNDFLSGLALPYRDWAQESLPLTDAERAMLQPDAQLLRRYTSPGHGFVEIAVIAGHRKKTVHTPDFCLVGGGWDTLSQHDVVLNVSGRKVPAVQALLLRNGERMMATYFFTDGETSTRSLPQFQLRQIMRRLGGRASLGAMVRILASAGGSAEEVERRSGDFAESTLSAVFAALTRAEK